MGLKVFYNNGQENWEMVLDQIEIRNNARVSVFWVFLVRIFPHSDWIRRDAKSECGKIRTRKTPNMDTFHAVEMLKFFKSSMRMLVQYALINFAEIILPVLDLSSSFAINYSHGICNLHIFLTYTWNIALSVYKYICFHISIINLKWMKFIIHSVGSRCILFISSG